MTAKGTYPSPKTMVRFSDNEMEYLTQNRLGRIATVSLDMQPHAVSVAYEFDGSYVYFSGWNLKNNVKFRNVRQNDKVAFVVDDLASINPWRPSGIQIRGTAEPIEKED